MLKVGDKVRINRCSEYHNRGNSNPHHSVVGVVTHIKGYGLPICVDWPRGSNNYNHKDLVKVGE